MSTVINKVGSNGAIVVKELDASDNVLSTELLSKKLSIKHDGSTNKITSFKLKEFDHELSNGSNNCEDFWMGDGVDTPAQYLPIDDVIATAELFYNS